MKIRNGRHNPYTLYLQTSDDPAPDDLYLGSGSSPSAAAMIAAAATAGLEHHPDILTDPLPPAVGAAVSGIGHDLWLGEAWLGSVVAPDFTATIAEAVSIGLHHHPEILDAIALRVPDRTTRGQ